METEGSYVAEAGDGIRSACVSDVLMTLRNTEQANQYGRHCVHSGARHVPPRVIASGNVSAASECRNESVHVRRDSSFRDTVDPFRTYIHLRSRFMRLYMRASFEKKFRNRKRRTETTRGKCIARTVIACRLTSEESEMFGNTRSIEKRFHFVAKMVSFFILHVVH